MVLLILFLAPLDIRLGSLRAFLFPEVSLFCYERPSYVSFCCIAGVLCFHFIHLKVEF